MNALAWFAAGMLTVLVVEFVVLLAFGAVAAHGYGGRPR